MRKIFILVGMALLLAFIGGGAGAALVNPGFEGGVTNGLPDGWSIYDSSSSRYGVMTSATTYDGTTLSAVEGSHFAWLSGRNNQSYNYFSQTVFLQGGDTLSGYARFDNFSSVEADYGAVEILLLGQVPWGNDVYATPWRNGSDTGWELWTWTEPSAGEYTVCLIANAVDNGDSIGLCSNAYFDAAPVSAAPIPGSFWLLITQSVKEINFWLAACEA